MQHVTWKSEMVSTWWKCGRSSILTRADNLEANTSDSQLERKISHPLGTTIVKTNFRANGTASGCFFCYSSRSNLV